jgi:D-sedoheptulose 7-phosphate isomerase
MSKRFMMECNSLVIIGFMNEIIKKHLDEHQTVLSTLESLAPQIEKVANHMIQALQNSKTIFWCGNGGSASDAQHLAGELVGRFVGDRKALKSISLNADSAVMTCIVNDYGYEHIFSRQVEGLGVEGDVLVGITTSGNSENVINALEVANQKQMTTIGLLGKGGGKALSLVSEAIVIDSNTTARIQEMHITIGHILCDLIEEGLHLKA